MKLSLAEVINRIKDSVEELVDDGYVDNGGQLLIYSNIYLHRDGSFDTEPEEPEVDFDYNSGYLTRDLPKP